MYNKDFVKNIFYSGSFTHNYDEQITVNISFLLNEKLLSVKKEIINTVDNYRKYVDDITSRKMDVFDFQGGGNGHLALKLIAEDYLRKKGYDKINFECEFEGYFPDVIIYDKTVIVECGNTNPDKIFNYFKNKNLKQLIVIPYPDCENQKITGYIFKPSAELFDFLNFKETEVLKSAFKKRK